MEYYNNIDIQWGYPGILVVDKQFTLYHWFEISVKHDFFKKIYKKNTSKLRGNLSMEEEYFNQDVPWYLIN